MQTKKIVKTRLIFQDDRLGMTHLDVISTFNMTERFYLDRDQDMLVEDENGMSWRILKHYILALKELHIINVEVEEVNPSSAGVIQPVKAVSEDLEDDYNS